MGGLKVGGGIAKLMDEREVEIGDRIRVLTSAGSWQTRTVDSVTYDNYQVTGFVASEPYEAGSVSTGSSESTATDATAKTFARSSHGYNVGDFVQVDATTDAHDGVYEVITGGGTDAIKVDAT